MAGPRIASLCSGFGGLEMAVQAVFGGETAFQGAYALRLLHARATHSLGLAAAS